MATVKATGVVIKSSPSGESDRRVVILTERGKIFATARGARKPKSKFKEAAALFAHSDFVLFDGGGFMAVTQADLINGFFGVTSGYERFSCACALCALCDRVFYEGMEPGPALKYLVTALKSLDAGSVPPKLPLSAFIFRVMRLEGFLPSLSESPLKHELSKEGYALAEYILEGKKTDVDIDDKIACELYGAADKILKEQGIALIIGSDGNAVES